MQNLAETRKKQKSKIQIACKVKPQSRNTNNSVALSLAGVNQSALNTALSWTWEVLKQLRNGWICLYKYMDGTQKAGWILETMFV